MHTLLLQRKPLDPLLNIRNLQALATMYGTAVPAAIRAAVPEVFAADDTINFRALDTVCPPAAWVIQGGKLVLYVAGTSGDIHLPQLLNGWERVYDDWQQQRGASGAFYNAARALLDAMGPSEVGQCNEVYLIGHSYGGAVCEAMAVLFLGQVTPAIRVWSYGSPRPGLFRLGTLMQSVTNTRIFTDDDPVRFIPPHTSEVPALAAIEDSSLMRGCNTQVQPPTGYQLLANGMIEETEGNPTVLTAMAFSLAAWVMDAYGFRSVNHGIQNYLTRFQAGLASGMPTVDYPGSRPREQPEVLPSRERERIENQGEAIIQAHLAVVPNINTEYQVPAIPPNSQLRFRRRKIGKVWGVKLGDDVVAIGPGKRAALRMARAYNRAGKR